MEKSSTPVGSPKTDLCVKNSKNSILRNRKLNPPRRQNDGYDTSGMFIKERSTINTNSIPGKMKRSAYATQNPETGNRVNGGRLKTKVIEPPQPKRKPMK